MVLPGETIKTDANWKVFFQKYPGTGYPGLPPTREQCPARAQNKKCLSKALKSHILTIPDEKPRVI